MYFLFVTVVTNTKFEKKQKKSILDFSLQVFVKDNPEIYELVFFQTPLFHNGKYLQRTCNMVILFWPYSHVDWTVYSKHLEQKKFKLVILTCFCSDLISIMSCLYLVKLFTLQNFKNYSSITFVQIKLFQVPIFPKYIELDMISEILGFQQRCLQYQY